MFAAVPTTPRILDDYRRIAGDHVVDEIAELAAPLREARVLHLSVSAFGTGLAELLNSLVPILGNIGLKVEWQIARTSEEFSHVSKSINDGLSGLFVQWTPQMEQIWLSYNAMNARLVNHDYDFVVVHDPQLAPILTYLTEQNGRHPGGKWIWHCHLDASDAQPQIWSLMESYVAAYDLAVFPGSDHLPEGAELPRVAFLPPAIDPLGPKNIDISRTTLVEGLQRYGVDPRQPLICQISRLDAYNDPLGVIEAYELAKKEIPALQLVLVALMIADTAEGWSYFERCAQRMAEDPSAYLLSELNGVGNTEINIFQRAARVVLQKSVRRGFGMGIAEAQWKARPVVAGRVDGYPVRVTDGVDGFMVDSVEDCADRIVFLLKHPRVAARVGLAGKENVRRNYLITRYLKDYLELLRSL